MGMDFSKKRNNNSHSKQKSTWENYQEYYRNMYGLGRPQHQSLSYIAEEIQKELKIMRKYPKASYDDLVEAAYRIVKTYTPGDFAAIRTEYGCNSRMRFFNKDAVRKELAEKFVASLKDYELRILMGR